MKKQYMFRFSFLSLVILGFGLVPWVGVAGELPRGDAQAAGFNPESLAEIEALLEAAVEEKQVAGGSALIARNGEVVYQTLVGKQDVEADVPLSAETIFRIASMTKPITSAAVLKLHDEGKLNLDDPLSDYLPEFQAPRVLVSLDDDEEIETVPAEREITVHDLLTHTSGLSYRFTNPPVLGRLYVEAAVSDGLAEMPGTIADNAKRIAWLPLRYQPGEAWEYGLSTDVLGRLIEVVSGQTLAEYFQSEIFEPLGMKDTHFILPSEKRSRLSALYTLGDDDVIRPRNCELVQNGPLVYSGTYPLWDDGQYYSGGAGLVSTIEDYARFLQMLLNRGELDGVRLLEPETVLEMTRDQIAALDITISAEGDGFGYGFGVVTERSALSSPAAVGSYTWGGFFSTYFWVDPQHNLFGILMTQIHPSEHLELRQDFQRLTYEALAGADD